ncbi:MAG TPA: tyrosine-type recombinase/integrase [Sphingobacterium sp.]|nr:tyrosine-type recombinase/integrase [Sphingobacterium sp.]
MNLSFYVDHTGGIRTIFLQLADENREIHILNTFLKIPHAEWDAEKMRPRNIYLKRYKTVNRKLDRIRIAVARYLNEISRRKEKLSIIRVRRLIKTATGTVEQPMPERGLLSFMDQYIQSRAHLISTSTFKRYMVFFRLLERFEGYRTKHLLLEETNASFVREFLEFGETEAYCQSTIYRTVHFVKTVLNYLEKRGVRTYAYELELPKLRTRSNIVTLSEDELIHIKKMEEPKRLQAAKDWLMISCYTGQRISDFMNFDLGKVEILDGKKYLSFIQQKTQKNIFLPIHPAIQLIMAKNRLGFPAKLATNNYNTHIKEIARMAGINKLVKIRKWRGFRAVESYVPKWEAVSSHIGRRSFASNFYGKIPTALLMEATGHATEQMFKRYIADINTDRGKTLGTYLEEAYKEKFHAA